MKRFFYTDPIAAAWMAKHHGMSFEVKQPWDERYPEMSPGTLALERAVAEFSARTNKPFPGMVPYFINPDSVHLLDPTHGDIVRLDKRMIECVERSEGGKWRKVWRCVNAYSEFLRCNNWIAPHVLEIVQRDGKAFIWPESVRDAL